VRTPLSRSLWSCELSNDVPGVFDGLPELARGTGAPVAIDSRTASRASSKATH
jgi:hypothetical protein